MKFSFKVIKKICPPHEKRDLTETEQRLWLSRKFQVYVYSLAVVWVSLINRCCQATCYISPWAITGVERKDCSPTLTQSRLALTSWFFGSSSTVLQEYSHKTQILSYCRSFRKIHQDDSSLIFSTILSEYLILWIHPPSTAHKSE